MENSDRPGASPPIHLPVDTPAERDAFGGHSKLADDIATHLSQNPYARVVGVFGAWGSGKTSVIAWAMDALRSKITNHPTIVHYDTWSSKPDAVAIGFLDHLIDDFSSRQWIDRDSCRADLAKVAGRYDSVETETTYRSSRLSLVYSLLLLLLPIAAGLATRGIAYLSNIALLVMASPFLLASFITVFRALARAGRLPRSVSRRLLAVEDNPLVSLLNRGRQRTVTETFRAAQPTPLDVRRFYRSVLQRAEAHLKSGLIIVFENVDRLDREPMYSVFDLIRNITFEADQGGCMGFSQVILSIDLSRVQSALGGKAELSAFLEKFFDVEFYVPPPLLLGWRRYFKECLLQVLPSTFTDAQAELAARLVELAQEARAEAAFVSPRHIRVVTNRIAVLANGFGYDFPPMVLALYAAFLEDVRGGALEFVQARASDRRIMLLVGDEHWDTTVLALHYRLPTEEVAQLLIRPRILAALTRNDQESIIRLSELSSFVAAVDLLIENEFQDFFRSGNYHFVLQSVSALLDHSVTAAIPSTALQRLLHFGGAYVGSGPMSTLDEATVVGFELLAKHTVGTMGEATAKDALAIAKMLANKGEDGSQVARTLIAALSPVPDPIAERILTAESAASMLLRLSAANLQTIRASLSAEKWERLVWVFAPELATWFSTRLESDPNTASLVIEWLKNGSRANWDTICSVLTTKMFNAANLAHIVWWHLLFEFASRKIGTAFDRLHQIIINDQNFRAVVDHLPHNNDGEEVRWAVRCVALFTNPSLSWTAAPKGQRAGVRPLAVTVSALAELSDPLWRDDPNVARTCAFYLSKIMSLDQFVQMAAKRPTYKRALHGIASQMLRLDTPPSVDVTQLEQRREDYNQVFGKEVVDRIAAGTWVP